MQHQSVIILVSFNLFFFLLGLILYVIPIFKMEDPLSFPAVQLCSGKLFPHCLQTFVSKDFCLRIYFLSFLSKKKLLT